jgi:KDO2-lipid IV(A) lauroyltransferase
MAFITKRDLPFLSFAAATLSLRALPKGLRHRRLGAFGNGLGALWYRLDRSDAALTRRNLQTVLGAQLGAGQVEATARALFQTVAYSKLLNDLLPGLGLADVQQILHIEGKEHLEQALGRGRGVVLLRWHSNLHGYIELSLLKLLGYGVVAVLGEEIEPDDSWVYQHVVHPIRRRSRRNFDVIDPNGTPQRAMLECLQKNQILMITGDTLEKEMLDMPAPQVLPVKLLGRTLPLMTGPFRMARWLQSPVVPTFVVPRPGGYTMVIEPPLALSGDNSAQGLAADLAAYVERFESYLLRYPTLWAHWRHAALLDLMKKENHPDMTTPSSFSPTFVSLSLGGK